MTLRTLLEKLTWPLFFLILFFTLTTFAAYFTHGEAWQRIAGFNMHRILQLLDLREENTLATWFSSQLFLITGLSFVLLGWQRAEKFAPGLSTTWIFRLAAIGACLLSADEVASIHESSGKRFGHMLSQTLGSTIPADDRGFLWIVLFAPILLVGLFMVTHALYQTKHADTHARSMTRFHIVLLGALICLPGVFVFEMLEVQATLAHQHHVMVFTCFEEMFELLGMYSLFLGAMFVAKQHQL